MPRSSDLTTLGEHAIIVHLGTATLFCSGKYATEKSPHNRAVLRYEAGKWVKSELIHGQTALLCSLQFAILNQQKNMYTTF